MSDSPPLSEIRLQNYPLWRSGKVRDIFDLGESLLFVATDRVSAFDVVLPKALPGKGRLLTGISRYWFERTQHISPNHVQSFDVDHLDLSSEERDQLRGRAMIVRKAERIEIECVVRARLAGSGWDEYRQHGTLAGVPLPTGLMPGDRLPELQFTPATKNDEGHDENISVQMLRDSVGVNLAELLEVTSKALLSHADRTAERAGFAIADTKFEFGFIEGKLVLIDEVLTPDSSRYWDISDLDDNGAPPGYDKQVIRDWLVDSGWNREPPAPQLPSDIVETAVSRYADVLRRLEANSNS